MSSSKKNQLPLNGVDCERLVEGQPYIYLKGKNAEEEIVVLYKRFVRLPNDVLAYNFRMTGYSGFVNLKEEEVRQRIYPYSIP